MQRDYNGAIGPYSQALELEKVNPKLEKSLWYVMIDNLGMSYGITGDLQKGQGKPLTTAPARIDLPHLLLQLGVHVRRDGQGHGSGDYLKKAFEYKANVLPGEDSPIRARTKASRN